jgi:hypothetical protein
VFKIYYAALNDQDFRPVAANGTYLFLLTNQTIEVFVKKIKPLADACKKILSIGLECQGGRHY